MLLSSEAVVYSSKKKRLNPLKMKKKFETIKDFEKSNFQLSLLEFQII